MRKYLLDTHIIIWILENDEKELNNFMKVLTDSRNSFFVSIASYWEMIIKSSIGKLKIPHDMISKVRESGIGWLNIELEHLNHIQNLPQIHTDPFDRLIVAQAEIEKMKILTTDHKVLQYL